MLASVWDPFFFSPFILPYLRFIQLFLRIRTRKMCRNFIEECYVSISQNRNRRTANCIGRSVSRGFHTYFACCSTWDLYSVLWELFETGSLTYTINVLSNEGKEEPLEFDKVLQNSWEKFSNFFTKIITWFFLCILSNYFNSIINYFL